MENMEKSDLIPFLAEDKENRFNQLVDSEN